MRPGIGTPAKTAKHDGSFGARDSAVQEFLDAFAHHLTAGDGRAIARLWGTPALVLSDDQAHQVSSAKEVEKFFSGAKEQYNSQGIADTRAEILQLDWLTERIVMVQVRWPHLDSHDEEHGEEQSTYVLVRDKAGDLKLRVALMQGATPG